jgi:hypothetical protein
MRVRSWVAGISAVTVFALMTASVVDAQTVPDTGSGGLPIVVDAATTPADLPAANPDDSSSAVASAAIDTAALPDTTAATPDVPAATPDVPAAASLDVPAATPDVPAAPAASAEPSDVSVTATEPVRFSNITDAVPGRFFDAGTTAPDPLNPNRLIIGFGRGADVQTWKLNEFTASTAAFYHRSAVDTISLLIEAPPGSYVSKITYTQHGRGAASRVAEAAGGTNWVVGDVAGDLGLFDADPTLSATIDLTGELRTVVPVSITTGLFAFGAAQVGTAAISVTGAELLVEVLPLLP